MNTKSQMDDRAFLLREITDKVLCRSKDGTLIFNPNGEQPDWLLDFRRGFSYPAFLGAVARLFWNEFDRTRSWQIGGIESASLPLVTALALTGNDVRSFYIRKSRKKQGLLKQIEGAIDSSRDIILVDDLMNSGSSLMKQIKVLESEMNLQVRAVFCIVRFRDLSFYTEMAERGIEIRTLFDLQDLGLSLGTRSLRKLGPADARWHFRAQRAHFFQQGRKNIPILYRDYIIHATDDGTVWQIDQMTGEVRWQRRVMLRPRADRKTFFGACVQNDVLYLATYRGVLMALQAETGKPKFKLPVENTFTNEFVLTPTHLYVGVNRGVGWNTFALVTVDLVTVEVQTLIETGAPVTGTIHIDEKRGLLVIVDATNVVYCLTMKGEQRWVRKCPGRNMAGVGTNEFGDVVLINTDGVTMVLHVETGATLDSFTLPEFHAMPPTVSGRYFYGATLGRMLYRYDYVSHTMDWNIEMNGRMYSGPSLLGRSALVVGDNNGRVYVVERKTGVVLERTILPERVTNPVLVTPTGMLISTFANDLYMLQRTADEAQPEAHGQNHQATDRDSMRRV